MADLVLTGIYDSAMRAFSTKGQGSERFEQDFIDSANRAINQINIDGDLSSRVSRVDDTGDTVTNLDEDYEHVITAGIWRWLILSGQKPSRGFERQVNHMAALFESYIAGMAGDLRNDLQDSQGADDDTTDIIGLGALG